MSQVHRRRDRPGATTVAELVGRAGVAGAAGGEVTVAALRRRETALAGGWSRAGVTGRAPASSAASASKPLVLYGAAVGAAICGSFTVAAPLTTAVLPDSSLMAGVVSGLAGLSEYDELLAPLAYGAPVETEPGTAAQAPAATRGPAGIAPAATAVAVNGYRAAPQAVPAPPASQRTEQQPPPPAGDAESSPRPRAEPEPPPADPGPAPPQDEPEPAPPEDGAEQHPPDSADGSGNSDGHSGDDSGDDSGGGAQPDEPDDDGGDGAAQSDDSGHRGDDASGYQSGRHRAEDDDGEQGARHRAAGDGEQGARHRAAGDGEQGGRHRAAAGDDEQE